MEYYVQVGPDGNSRGSWSLGNGIAKRLGIPFVESTNGAYAKADAGETEIEALRRLLPTALGSSGTDRLEKLELGPGEYYPRMARPSSDALSDSPGIYPGDHEAADEMAIAHGQMAVLTADLEQICRTVHPRDDNLKAYGHEIRNLLILACTEAEAFWRGVLAENHVPPVNRRDFTTNDYVKLASVMRLREYGVYYSAYPWLKIIKPFEAWGTTGAPTKELAWYDDYNSVKHDREGQFHRATLASAFHAVAGCFVMLFAQYGINQRQSLRAKGVHLLNVVEVPKWSPAESYLYPFRFEGRKAVRWTAKPVDYPF